MEEKYIKLLAKTDYNALTSEEKELLNELCTNQSEFEQAKQLMNELTALDPEPNLFDSSKVKKRLDDEFLEIDNLKINGIVNQNSEEFLKNFNSKKYNILNKIIFKNSVKNFFQNY